MMTPTTDDESAVRRAERRTRRRSPVRRYPQARILASGRPRALGEDAAPHGELGVYVVVDQGLVLAGMGAAQSSGVPHDRCPSTRSASRGSVRQGADRQSPRRRQKASRRLMDSLTGFDLLAPPKSERKTPPLLRLSANRRRNRSPIAWRTSPNEHKTHRILFRTEQMPPDTSPRKTSILQAFREGERRDSNPRPPRPQPKS